MWLFASGGLVLPALLPEKVLAEAKTKDIQEAVERGWELQVRGRVVKHLEWFAETYMEPGTFSAIYESPDKDYNCRFYTTREDYGNALKNMALAIDYTKFKDTSLRFPWGKKYHDLLLSIWSMSTRLAPAGGFYGAWSQDNPRGYRSRSYYRGAASRDDLALLDEHEPAPFDLDGDYDPDWLDDLSDEDFKGLSFAEWEAREAEREEHGDLIRGFQIERAKIQEKRSRRSRRRAEQRRNKKNRSQA